MFVRYLSVTCKRVILPNRSHTIQYNPTQYNTIPRNTIQYNTHPVDVLLAALPIVLIIAWSLDMYLAAVSFTSGGIVALNNNVYAE